MAAHVGGKLATGLTAPAARRPRPRHRLHARCGGGQPGHRRRPRARRAATRGRDRLVAVVSDGTAVLGLGDIGPRAALPVMEGKSALFKTFGGLDSIPIVLDTTDVDEIVETLVRLRPSFGAVNLEDVVGAALLRARAPADRGAGLPGHARRPARHRDRPARRAARGLRGRGPRPGAAADRDLRSRCGGGGVRAHPAGRRGRGRRRARLPRRAGPGPRRRDGGEGGARRRHQPAAGHRRGRPRRWRTRTSSWACRARGCPRRSSR